MESNAAYLTRKRAELELLASYLSYPYTAGPIHSTHEVIAEKLRLRGLLLADATIRHNGFTESNYSGEPSRGYFEYSVKYGYQRYDLQVRSKPLYDIQTSRPETPNDYLWATSFTNCGMASIAAVLFSLDLAAPKPVTLVGRDDIYYETTKLVRAFLRNTTFRSLSSEETASEAIAQYTKPRDDVIVLFVDSICSQDPRSMLARIEGSSVDLIVFDTTCYLCRSPVIAEIALKSVTLNVPVVLLRSHVKLDSLGIEYARLGSTVIGVPITRTPSSGIDVDTFLRAYRSSTALLGLRPTPFSLFPFMHDDNFHALNEARIARIRANNCFVADEIAGQIGSCYYKVREFSHGLFITVDFNHITSRDELLAAIRSFQAMAVREMLPVRISDSFGFDFISLIAYTELPSLRSVLRLSASDATTETVGVFARLFVRWLEQQVPAAPAMSMAVRG